jgi:hypothetical protein
MDTSPASESLVPFARELATVAARLDRRASQLDLRTFHVGATAAEVRTLTVITCAMKNAGKALADVLIAASVHGEDEHCDAVFQLSAAELLGEVARSDA